MMFAIIGEKLILMCRHRYFLKKTKIVKIGTYFSQRKLTTEYYECKYCGKTTFVKKELMVDKFEIPPLTILDCMN